MKTITIAYYHISKFEDLEWEHNTVIDYSKEKRDGIFNLLMDKGYTVMAMPCKETLIMYIGKGKLTQR